ncbi:MAG: PA14 domain-containing protein [Parvularculaceae bacterium]
MNGNLQIKRTVRVGAIACAFALACSPAAARFSVFYHQDGRNLRNVDDAAALIAETDAVAVQQLDHINISDFRSTRSEGRFSDGTTAAPLANRDNFAVYAVGRFDVADAGDFTFLLHSDDGARLTVNGEVVAEFFGQRAPRDTFSAPVFLDAGRHLVEIVYFEHRGEAALELGIAPGAVTTFSSSAFSLVGTAPEPAAWLMMLVGFAGVANRLKARRRGQRSSGVMALDATALRAAR